MIARDRLARRTVEQLPSPTAAFVAECLAAPATPDTHAELARRAGVFDAVEVHQREVQADPGDTLTIAAWNAERLKFREPSAALVAGTGADLLLLTETDVGMVRSGNRHTTADLADDLGMGYAFGVEFLELGLGDSRERVWHAGERNAAGLHGDAILSRFPLQDVTLIRLDDGGVWWGSEVWDNQKRLGWRMAIAARILMGGQRLFVVAAHLESKSDAADRAVQVKRLIAALDELSGGDPVVIGGDFNTAALPLGAADVQWQAEPDPAEPLFALFAAAGYEWRSANEPTTTRRAGPDGTGPARRIDWLFTRGVRADKPKTLEAVSAGDGSDLSGHDLISARLTIAR